MHNKDKWDQNNVVVDNIFVFQVALEIIRNDEILNHKMWKNVKIEMIGQNGKKLKRQN